MRAGAKSVVTTLKLVMMTPPDGLVVGISTMRRPLNHATPPLRWYHRPLSAEGPISSPALAMTRWYSDIARSLGDMAIYSGQSSVIIHAMRELVVATSCRLATPVKATRCRWC